MTDAKRPHVVYLDFRRRRQIASSFDWGQHHVLMAHDFQFAEKHPATRVMPAYIEYQPVADLIDEVIANLEAIERDPHCFATQQARIMFTLPKLRRFRGLK